MTKRLEDLRKESITLLEKALSTSNNPVIGFSGGKDSTLILHLARSIDPDIPAVFCDTGVEAPETYDYVRTIDNLITVKNERGYNFWNLIDKYGWPGIKGKRSGKRGNPCCHYLKEYPMKLIIKTNGYDLLIDGLTMAESRQRMMFLKSYGPYHYVKSWKIQKVHPIYKWHPSHVMEYLRSHGIPYNKIYDPPKCANRVGCQPCTAYKSWRERLAVENPQLFKLVLERKDGIKVKCIYDYIEEEIFGEKDGEE